MDCDKGTSRHLTSANQALGCDTWDSVNVQSRVCVCVCAWICSPQRLIFVPNIPTIRTHFICSTLQEIDIARQNASSALKFLTRPPSDPPLLRGWLGATKLRLSIRYLDVSPPQVYQALVFGQVHEAVVRRLRGTQGIGW